MKIKNFTELSLEQTDAGAVAQYMDEQMGEETLIKIFGCKSLTYGLIALNKCLELDLNYELVYPFLIANKPTTQEEIDEIFSKLF
jgi:hypothetical protein